MTKVTSQSKFMMIAIWLILIGASMSWNIYQVRQSREDVYLQTARSLFELIVTTRQWNSGMGGVYVPVTETLKPNPYLEAADRDVALANGKMLTRVNPAYMTRMISELSHEKNLAQFHITSLNPIRPANAPNEWESAALVSFDQHSLAEYVQEDKTHQFFYYMAPLYTEQSCLACHARQGYKVGDVRGGISIELKTQPENLMPLLVSHMGIGLVGTVIIWVFSKRLKRVFDILEKQSSQDFLTQIANRNHFETTYQREFRIARRYKQPLSVLLCDVDHFKTFNDQYGHQAGDMVLIEIAKALAGELKRPSDMVSRYGGEEFLVLLPQTPLHGAVSLAENLRRAVESVVITYKGARIDHLATISIGAWVYNGENVHPDEILEKADQALYTAKRLGRNRVCIYQEAVEPVSLKQPDVPPE